MEAHNNDNACFFLDKPEYNNPIPGTMIQTPADAILMYSIFARSNCLFGSVVSELPPVPEPVGVPVKLNADILYFVSSF